MAGLDAKVAEQHRAFLVALPQLMGGAHRGRWVAWLDGAVLEHFVSESDATDWLLDHTAFDSGAIVVCVEHPKPVLLSAAAAVFRRVG